MHSRRALVIFTGMVLMPATLIAATDVLDTVAAEKQCMQKLLTEQAKQAKSQPTGGIVENSDKCINDSITIKDGKPTVRATKIILPKVPWTKDLKWCVRNACKPSKQTQCGTITYTIPAAGGGTPTTKTISKCDANASSILGQLSGNTSGAAAQSIAQQAIEGIKATDGTLNQNALSQALQNTGVSKDTADAIAKDPSKQQDAYAMLQSLASGDVDTAKQTASDKLGITLNEDTLNKISELKPEGFKDLVSGGVANEDQQRQLNDLATQSTFVGAQGPASPSAPVPGGRYGEMLQQVEQKYGIPAGVLARYMKVESNGNPTVCSFAGACGLFQYTGKTWDIDSARINGGVPLDRSLRMNPEVSAQVTAGSIAYYQQRYGDLIQQSGLDTGTAAYLIHNIGVGDGPKFLQAYAMDPNMRVSDIGLQGVSIRNNPANFGDGSITLSQAVARIEGNMSGEPTRGGLAVASPIAGAFSPQYSGAVLAPYASPFTQIGGWPSAYSTPAPAYSTAPVGAGGYYSSPVSGGGYYSYPSSGGTIVGTPVGSGYVVPSYSSGGSSGITNTNYQATYQTPAPVQVQPIDQTAGSQLQVALQPTVQTVSTPVPAVAQIIAQPRSVRVGSTVLVSWSSTGMSSRVPCVIYRDAEVLTQTNAGSRTIPVDHGGTTAFRMRCTTAAGIPLEASTTVSSI